MKEKLKEWAIDVLIRTLKTMAEVASGMFTIGLAMSEINWSYMASVSLAAGIWTIIFNIANIPIGKE